MVADDGSQTAVAVIVGQLDAASGGFSLVPEDKDWSSVNKPAVADVRLLALSKKIAAPRLNGPGVVALDEGHGFTKGDVAAWQESGGASRFALILESDETAIRFNAKELFPLASQEIFRAQKMVRAQFKANEQSMAVRGHIRIIRQSYSRLRRKLAGLPPVWRFRTPRTATRRLASGILRGGSSS